MAFTQLKSKWQKSMNGWLNQRMPPAHKQELNHKNIFILPSRFGVVYLLFTVVLFLLGTNYQNNIIILLSFLLASLFVTAMHHSFFNLSGLTVSSYAKPHCFADKASQLSIELTTSKPRYHLSAQFDQHPATSHWHCSKGSNDITVPLYFNRRGLVPLTRLKIVSQYPLGLFTTWTKLDLDLTATVYPSVKQLASHYRKDDNNRQVSEDDNNANQVYDHQQMEEFLQLAPYQQGQSLAHIAWKQVATGQGWFSKQYGAPQSDDIWLSLKQIPIGDIEDKLSYLTGLILDYDKQQQAFGLQLSNETIAPNQGSQHVKACLTALAKY